MFLCKCVHESTITCMFPCITPVSAHFWPHWKRVHYVMIPTYRIPSYGSACLLQEPVLAEPGGHTAAGDSFCQSVWTVTSLIDTRGRETEAELTATVHNPGQVGSNDLSYQSTYLGGFSFSLCVCSFPLLVITVCCCVLTLLLPNGAIWRHDLCELSISLWEFIWGF